MIARKFLHHFLTDWHKMWHISTKKQLNNCTGSVSSLLAPSLDMNQFKNLEATAFMAYIRISIEKYKKHLAMSVGNSN